MDDKANLHDVSQNETFWNKFKLSDLTWTNSSLISDVKQNIIMLEVNTNSKELSFTNNGSLTFRVGYTFIPMFFNMVAIKIY